MIERDYILRMIRELATVCSRILGFRETGEFAKAGKELSDAGEKYLGVKWPFVAGLSDRQLIELFGAERQPDKLTVAAELLREESDLLDCRGESGASIIQGMKAFSIFAELTGRSDHYLKIFPRERYEALLQRLLEYELTPELRQKIISYYLLTGQLRKAEALVRMVMDTDQASADSAGEFYHALLKRTDADLEREGMSRGRIKDAIMKIKTGKEHR